jgi:hypothetical protein
MLVDLAKHLHPSSVTNERRTSCKASPLPVRMYVNRRTE